MNIKKGDQVKILKGKDRGKSGKVIKVNVSYGLVTVEGLNIHQKNVRAKNAGEKGQVVKLPTPLHVSNLAVVCPACGKSTRIGYRRSTGGNKERYCKQCNATI
ncbi:MAG: 50S ribosomal protein L24 [Patescibacteria group bacterium]|nr:50S ribosomal protein L24 [Patescibacteria group bacterium]MCL5224005.1 50S ribosomal protein L24 [Patescibacteria group bacterium]